MVRKQSVGIIQVLLVLVSHIYIRALRVCVGTDCISRAAATVINLQNEKKKNEKVIASFF